MGGGNKQKPHTGKSYRLNTEIFLKSPKLLLFNYMFINQEKIFSHIEMVIETTK